MEISAVRSPAAAREKPISVMKKLFADMLYIYTLSSIIFREREREKLYCCAAIYRRSGIMVLFFLF
jgi:hypothetical protein